MSSELQQIEAAIAALEGQRAALGDLAADAMLAGLQARRAALQAARPAEPPQSLRQVSILFLDVVGSTALARQLDPEAVGAVMDGALARGTAIVQAHGGKVLQYAGDNILAAFGAEEAREDDAERAVHCGLALLALGRTLGAEVLAAHGHAGFDVRVGIHTGGVLLGGGVDAEGTIRGVAVNIAARMEQTAPAGALRISHDTWVQVRGLFEIEAQPPLAVKGVDAPLRSVLVRRARPRWLRQPARGIEGVATRMVGRDAELAALQAAHARLFSERSLAAVTVVADAGLGKSRLLDEFDAWAALQPQACQRLRGRATPRTATQAFGLLRDVIAARFEIGDDDSLDTARAKLEAGIVPLFVHDDGPDLAEGHAHLLGHLIGIEWAHSRHLRGILDDPRQIRSRALHAALQWLRRSAAGADGPLLLQLEDLHWADGESLDFLRQLCAASPDLPLLLLGSTRPTLFERQGDWAAGVARHERIELQPLGRGDSHALAGELLQRLPDVPAALQELLCGRAEGNPFYMEELTRMLIDQGAIRTGAAWSVDAERLLVTQVPPTLTGVLQARLDGLPGPEKRALQQASVVGAVFWEQALAAMDPQAPLQLPALTRRQLVLPRADAPLAGLSELAFRHAVLHQVTYDTVLRRHKRAGHARVARWLADCTGQGGLRAGDLLGLAAQHFEQAGEAASAAEFHARAAEHAAQRFAHERVLAHVARALALLEPPEQAPAPLLLRWRLHIARERTLDLLARRDEQAADLDALEQIAEALDDDRRRAEAARRRSFRAMRMADLAEHERAAGHALACAGRAGDDSLRLQALRLLAVARLDRGDIDAGRALVAQGLAEARQLGLREVEGRMLNVLSIALGMQGDLFGAQQLHLQNLEIKRETGDRLGEAVGLSNLGEGWMNLGQLARARHDLDAALQLLRANGDRAMEGATLAKLSTLAVWQGDAERARGLARQALDFAGAARATDLEMLAWLRLAEAELALGQTAEARAASTRALALARAIDDPAQHDARTGHARAALAEGDTAAALQALQDLLSAGAAAAALDGTDQPRLIELTCHQALARAGDPRAADWLARAHATLAAQAEAITEPTVRQGFIDAIPHHREIIRAWAALQRDGGKSAR